MSSGDSNMFERRGLCPRMRWLAVILIIVVGYLDVSAAELTKIYAGYGGIAGYQLPLWINKEIGISRKYGIDIEPLSGARVQDVVAKLYGTPPAIVERARKAIRPD